MMPVLATGQGKSPQLTSHSDFGYKETLVTHPKLLQQLRRQLKLKLLPMQTLPTPQRMAERHQLQQPQLIVT